MAGTFVGRFRHSDRVTRINDGELSNHEELERALLGEPDMSQKKTCEPIQDDAFEEKSEAEIAKMSSAEYEAYEKARRKAKAEGDAAHVYDPDELEPSLQGTFTGLTPRIAQELRTSGTYEPGIQGQSLSPEERFARASDRRWSRNPTPATRDASPLTPSERFAAASARRWAPNPNGRAEAIRRRRSE